jgi:hypothetical protein
MADTTKPQKTPPAPAEPAAPANSGKPPTTLVKGVILADGVFSSQGKHSKGEKVELPLDDVVSLEANNFITRI